MPMLSFFAGISLPLSNCHPGLPHSGKTGTDTPSAALAGTSSTSSFTL
jgi:hypothetical protein